jgi:hypothetical protein
VRVLNAWHHGALALVVSLTAMPSWKVCETRHSWLRASASAPPASNSLNFSHNNTNAFQRPAETAGGREYVHRHTFEVDGHLEQSLETQTIKT